MAFLRIPWFWLNCSLALICTLPVPLISIEINGAESRRVPVYECYLNLFQGQFNRWNWIGVGLQIAICLLMTGLVYAFVLRAKAPEATAPEETE